MPSVLAVAVDRPDLNAPVDDDICAHIHHDDDGQHAWSTSEGAAVTRVATRPNPRVDCVGATAFVCLRVTMSVSSPEPDCRAGRPHGADTRHPFTDRAPLRAVREHEFRVAHRGEQRTPRSPRSIRFQLRPSK